MTDIPGTPPEEPDAERRYDAPPPMPSYEPYYATPVPGAAAGGAWPTLRRRPRFDDLLGAAGGLLAIIGIITLLSELVGSSSNEKATSGVAALIAAGVVAAAYVGLNALRAGAGAAALVVVALLGAALPMPFVVAAQDSPSPKGSATLVLLVPTLAWAFLYFTGPARGRLVFLGGALLGLWLIVMAQVVDLGGPGEFATRTSVASSSGWTNTAPSGGVLAPVDMSSPPLATTQEDDFTQFEEGEFEEEEGPDFFSEFTPFDYFFGDSPDSLGIISLLFGVGYLAAAVALHRRGARGGATPFVAIGDIALVSSLVLLRPALDDVGISVVGLLVGGSLCWFGAWTARRATSWLGVLIFASGVGGLVATITDDAVPGGVLLLVAGVLVVVAASQISGPAAAVEDDAVV